MRSLIIALLACLCLSAQPTSSYRIDTFAGTLPLDEGVPAITAILDSLSGFALGKDGSLYVASTARGIRKVSPAGIISQVRGASGVASAVVVDAAGNLSFITAGGPELYRLPANSDTVITSRPAVGDLFRTGTFSGIAIDSRGNVLLADQNAKSILRVSSTGAVSVAAGFGSGSNLPATPNRLAVDSHDNFYLTLASQRIVRVSPDGFLMPVAGSGTLGPPTLGAPATQSAFVSLGALTVNSRGELFVVERNYRMILKVNVLGVLELVAGGVDVLDMSVDDKDDLIVAELNGTVSQLNENGSRKLIAGREQFDGDGGPAANALLKLPRAVSIGPENSVLIADTGNNRIRRVASDGVMSTVAGNGVAGFVGDGGLSVAAQVSGPEHLVADESGNVYFGGTGYLKVRRIRPDGVVETFAGTGDIGTPGDGGPAKAATFKSIDGLALDRTGRLFISDASSNRVRIVTSDGIINTFAGTDEPSGNDEGVLATKTPLNRPSLLAVDKEGNVLIYESGLARLRRVSTTGIVTTLSRTLPLGTPGDQLAQSCLLSPVSGLAFDIDGSLLVAGRNCICRLMMDGTSWLIAGGLQSGFSGDGGAALSAALNSPAGLSVGTNGNVFVADRNNHRIRRLQSVAGTVPSLSYDGLVGAGGSTPPIRILSPGGFMSIFGSNFAPQGTAMAVQLSDFVNGSLPTKLANTCVQVGTERGFLTFVGSSQINFQAPSVPVDATVGVEVVANCDTSAEMRSGPLQTTTSSVTPEFLYWLRNADGSNPIVAVNSVTGAYVGAPGLIPGVAFSPAKPGDVLSLYCISLGATNPAVLPGSAASGPASTSSTVVVRIGSTDVSVLYAGLSPGTAGLYQVNIRVPDLEDGDYHLTMRWLAPERPRAGSSP